ncbi:MAG: large-conductance mechanosensitive channel protein MscL [Bacteroidetes bacterium]|nr:large-conductance mechanosensitive channel protein MscL [Bacteroidota bacterium]MBU1485741.1 large-conductance mechanosensitive channel protein MscL [Bacteroidota bacterium]MBU2047259.1 large-conductance mechanosensitive channel protein MscL [Bacteroidota bacterium]MBU2268890.1 large-conductance mechanosensitive channel protein MscL [Bacteroidota bacterium]MBU2376318.1 large-conductance mechanosensitive channel protein MscL [Bacteroidota bacterium]
MGFAKEFKDFALKGNLADIAIGFVMGAAFIKVTSSFINGMVMPLVGMIKGKDFSDWRYVLKPAEIAADGTEKVAEVAIKYGEFLTVTLEFIIVAFFMFLLVKFVNKMKRKEEAAPSVPPAPSKEEILLSEIRDLLKSK